MASLLRSLACAGREYFERAIQVTEVYIDEASYALSEEKRPRPRQISTESKLPRVPASVDLPKMRRDLREQSLVYRARRTGTRLLCRLEAIVDAIAPPEEGDTCDAKLPHVHLGSLYRCPSESSLGSGSASFVSSSEEASEASQASELCLTSAQMIPRALVLPLVLPVQIARIMVVKATSLASATAASGCDMLLSSACYCTLRAARGTFKVASQISICRRVASLVDGLVLESVPRVRRVIVFALTDHDAEQDSKHSKVIEAHRLRGDSNDGGTGSLSQ